MLTTPSARQVFVLTALFILNISEGYIFGQMSGMVAALQSKDSEIPLSDDHISWIAATINATAILGFAVAGIVTEKFGRRRSITILSIPILANWLLLYFAYHMSVFMISRIIVGICFGGILTLNAMAVAEYTSPNKRAFFSMVISCVGGSTGIAFGHILGIMFHWRTNALIGLIPTALSAIMPLFWVESPSWLASKGRFQECEMAYVALHGNKKATQIELQLLINTERQKRQESTGQSTVFIMRKIMLVIREKYFWKIAFLFLFVIIYRAAVSKMLFTTLAITMLQEITQNSDVLFFTLLVDGFVIVGAALSCLLISKLKVRTLLFTTGTVANLLLYSLSFCLYYIPKDSPYYSWVNTSLLAIYFILIHAGPFPLTETFYCEMFPLELKAYFMFFFGAIAGIAIFLSVKLAPSMFIALGYHGVFFLNASLCAMCLVFLWSNLPETKGRTLQEIELYFKNNKFVNVNRVINKELEVLT